MWRNDVHELSRTEIGATLRSRNLFPFRSLSFFSLLRRRSVESVEVSKTKSFFNVSKSQLTDLPILQKNPHFMTRALISEEKIELSPFFGGGVRTLQTASFDDDGNRQFVLSSFFIIFFPSLEMFFFSAKESTNSKLISKSKKKKKTLHRWDKFNLRLGIANLLFLTSDEIRMR